MTQARGYRSQLLLDFETTFGVDPTTKAAVLMPFETNNVAANQNLTEDNTIRNRRDPAKPSRGNVDVAGQVVVPIGPTSFGYSLKALFGDPTTTDGGLSEYSHAFKPGDTQPSFVLDRGFTDIDVYEKFSGCKVSQMAITLGGDGALTAAIDIMGAKNTVGTTAYAASPTTHTDTRFSNFQATLQENSVAVGVVTTADFQINASLDGNQYVIGSQGFRQDIPEGLIQISGNLTALFKDKQLMDKAINGTETSLKFGLEDGLNSLEFHFPEVEFGRGSPAVEGPQGVVITLPWRAYCKSNDPADASVIVTLVNGLETY
jgi:hypothetical protein